MSSTVSYRLDTPCGFEIWLIPSGNEIKTRVFFAHEEVGMEALNGRLSKQGAKQLGAKLIEIAAL